MTVETSNENPQQATVTWLDWRSALRELGPVFASRAPGLDERDEFAAENYADLKRHKFFSAGVPAELGGGGLSHRELCAMLRELATYCGSTALALAMHQHLLAAAVWRYKRGLPGEALLRRIANEEIVLVTTGGRDWLASNGQATRVDGGYRVTARKPFCSGGPAGDVLISSVAYDDPQDGPSVLHFAVPLKSEGISFEEDWHTLGMRGTGSNTVNLRDVLVPEAAVSLKRPQGKWHAVWGTVLGVAMPLIMSAYVGVAEAAAETAIARARRAATPEPQVPFLVGELRNNLTTARMAVDAMVALSNDYAFEPTIDLGDAILVRKTICANAVVATVEKAVEVAGGAGFYRAFGLERLLRDVHGAPFHPLPEKQQQLFSGRIALGLDPA